MLKIIIGVVIGIILGVIILKYWIEILTGIVKLIAISLSIILIILLSPISLFQTLTFSEKNYQKRIVSLYDAIFFKDKSKGKVKRHVKSIESLNKFVRKNNQKKQEKSAKKLLRKAKWAL